MGIEPIIFRLEAERLIHWATRTKVVGFCWFHIYGTLPLSYNVIATSAGFDPATTGQ